MRAGGHVLHALVLSGVVLVGTTAPVQAVPVQADLVVTSGTCSVVGPGPLPLSQAIQCVDLAGDGFSQLGLLAGADSPSASTRSKYANPLDGTIPPGTLVTPFNSELFVDEGHGTVLGVPYDAPPYFFRTLAGEDRLGLFFTESIELPPVGTEPLMFSAPFIVTPGAFGIYRLEGGLVEHLLQLRMSGAGTGTITFLPAPAVDGWLPGSTEYVFGPAVVPEPGTLVLFVTTAAALGAVIRRGRRPSA